MDNEAEALTLSVSRAEQEAELVFLPFPLHYRWLNVCLMWHSQHCTVWAVLQCVVCLAVSKPVLIPETEFISEAMLWAMILLLSP